MSKKYWIYDFTIGRLGIAVEGEFLKRIFFSEYPIKGYIEEETDFIKNVSIILEEYLIGKRYEFDIPLALDGTNFQKAVWKALTEIPYGETRSYLEVASIIGNPKAVRAVGLANNRNPIAIIVPCHRVIGKNGKLVGYAGGLQMKEDLLKLELANK